MERESNGEGGGRKWDPQCQIRQERDRCLGEIGRYRMGFVSERSFLCLSGSPLPLCYTTHKDVFR